MLILTCDRIKQNLDLDNGAAMRIHFHVSDLERQ
jgi:hypothetical protein